MTWSAPRQMLPRQSSDRRVEISAPGIEPGTFCVLGRCDNHYTTLTIHTATTRRANGPLDGTLWWPGVHKCISRESNPGLIDGNDEFYH